MQRITIHGAEMVTPDGVHALLKDRLDLPDYYGANLNALWDCLAGWVELPLEVEWVDFRTSQARLGSFAEELCDTFQQAAEEIEGFTFKLS